MKIRVRQVGYFGLDIQLKYKFSLKSFYLLFTVIILFPYRIAFAQDLTNFNPTKMLLKESDSYHNKNSEISRQNEESFIKIFYNQKNYINTNLPNLENQGGLVLNKGFGIIQSFLFKAKNKHFSFEIEPQKILASKFNSPSKIDKSGIFSVLNDNYNEKSINRNIFKNLNINLNYKSIFIEYGNKNHWWGPAIHNNLIMTNNSQGFYHWNFGFKDNILGKSNIRMNFNYIISNPIKNSYQSDFFLSSSFLSLKYKNLNFGLSRTTLSGGYSNLKWNMINAALVQLTNKNIRYWNEMYDFYISYNSDLSNLVVFLELGLPSRPSSDIYYDHGLGSNIGLRKYELFGIKQLLFGFEYIRLIQSRYYNILPTTNWYDNSKFNYHSYKNIRWAAHSGSDSDDFLVFLGIMSEKFSIINGINYERHGVSFHFPPEVKLEYRFSITYKLNRAFFQLNYENEYFEHYGFVDSATNVWDETFEKGSIQRTNTLLLSLEYTLF